MDAVKKEKLFEIAAQMEWFDINSIARRAVESGAVTEEFKEWGWQIALKQGIRNQIRRMTDGEGAKLFHSVVMNVNGRKQRVYKQEALFDIGDYRQAVEYHANRVKVHKVEAETLVTRCRERYFVQLALPWAVNE